MRTIQIQANPFFEMLKTNTTSMWEVFSQMIDGEEKDLIFLDDEEKILFDYRLPESLEKLEEDRKKFTKEFAEKIAKLPS